MTVVLDTSMVLSLLDADDVNAQRAAAWIGAADDDLTTSPVAVAEMDYFAGRLGPPAQDALWRDLEVGAYAVRWWADALKETLAVARRHPFLGLTDASLVALAGRLNTNRIATFDQHFRSITTPSGEPFVLLPDDA